MQTTEVRGNTFHVLKLDFNKIFALRTIHQIPMEMKIPKNGDHIKGD